MIEQGRADQEQWLVEYDKNESSFASFEKALTFANKLATEGHGVKLIDLEKNTIRLQRVGPVTWGEDPNQAASASTRIRRTTD